MARIPRDSQWYCDSIYVGRVALRCFSSHSGSYWWPRRKCHFSREAYGSRQKFAIRLYKNGSSVQKREYDGYSAEERRHNDSSSFIETIPGGPQKDQKNDNAKTSQIRISDMSTNKYWDMWLSAKGSRWTAAWTELESQVDEVTGKERIKRGALPDVQFTSSIPLVARENAENDFEDALKETGEPVFSEVDTTKELQSQKSLGTVEADTKPLAIDPNDRERWLERLPREDIMVLSGLTEDVSKDPFSTELDNLPTSTDRVTSLSEGEQLDLELGVKFSREIHVLGTGPVGLHIAHSLSQSAHAPPVTLLMHRPLLMQQWHEEGATIRVVKDKKLYSSTKINIESAAWFGNDDDPERKYPGFGPNLEHTAEQPRTAIQNLIVTTEGHKTVQALSAIQHRLKSTTTICFVHGGLGLIEEVNEVLFPNPKYRPSYMLANLSHAIYPTDYKYTVVEQKAGELSFTIVPKVLLAQSSAWARPTIYDTTSNWPANSRYIVRTFTTVPEFSAKGLGMAAFYSFHLEKLALNSVIGPLTVMYDCFDNELLHNHSVTKIMRALLQEISKVLCALPELRRVNGVDKRFNPDKLEKIIVGICTTVGRQRSVMALKASSGNPTDIEYYNGYILRRAEELGIDCPRLEMVMAMVKAKQVMKRQELNNLIRFEKGNPGNKVWSQVMAKHR